MVLSTSAICYFYSCMNIFHCVAIPQSVYSYLLLRDSWVVSNLGAVIHKAALNTLVHVLSFLWGQFLGVELLCHVIPPC